jgi:chromosome segregation ATPase
MNVVGKVFTVLILVMALAFMALALMVYAVSPDWRTRVMSEGGLNKQWLAAKAEKTSLTKEKEQLEARIVEEKDRYVKRLAALEREKTDLLATKDSQSKALAEKEKAIATLAEAIATIHESVKSLFADASKVRGETKTIVDQRRKTFEQVIRLTDDLMNAVTERLRLAKLGRELQSQLARLVPATDPATLPNHN